MQVDVAIIGAGAAGMMCAAHAPGRVLIVDHAKAPGEKIRISGGGRCNFTNLHCGPHAFLSRNPHFAKSALARYTQWDFIDLVDRHGIAWHEKTLGQLFCDQSAREIVQMLRDMMADNGVELHLQTSVDHVAKSSEGFALTLRKNDRSWTVNARQLVVASGGKSIPKMGATGFAYEIAEKFAVPVRETHPALVPFTMAEGRFSPISGVSTPARVAAGGTAFEEALLFTHRGLSGPAALQASSYWQAGESVAIDLMPGQDLAAILRDKRVTHGKRKLTTVMSDHLPARLVAHLADEMELDGTLADQSDKDILKVSNAMHGWDVRPSGTEGYRTAEVTLGGIDTDALESRSMEARAVPGLYFIGEAVDVTGWLGGYNFQWAWASGMAAARALKSH